MAAGFAGSGFYFFVGRIRFAEADIVLYRILEQVNVLEDHRDMPHQGFGFQLLHVLPVQHHFPFLRVIETGA